MGRANGTLKTYPRYPHGMPVTHADVLTLTCWANLVDAEDLKKISVPVLVMQGEDDQVVNPATATRAVKLVLAFIQS